MLQYHQMRKFLSIIISAALITLFCCSLAAAYMASVKTEGTKLYLTPEIDEMAEIFDFPANYPLKVIETRGEWSRVADYLKLKGWVQTSALSSERMLIVTRAKVMLRAGPGTGNAIVTKLYQGQILKYVGCRKSWYKVKVVDPPDGGDGWVKRTLVWG